MQGGDAKESMREMARQCKRRSWHEKQEKDGKTSQRGEVGREAGGGGNTVQGKGWQNGEEGGGKTRQNIARQAGGGRWHDKQEKGGKTSKRGNRQDKEEVDGNRQDQAMQGVAKQDRARQEGEDERGEIEGREKDKTLGEGSGWFRGKERRYLVGGTLYLVGGTLYLVGGTLYLDGGTLYLVGGTLYLVGGPLYLVGGTLYLVDTV